jgi:hypothetical protein
LSGDALLTIVIALIGIGGVVFPLDWFTRSLLVLGAVGLTTYAALRHSARPAPRILVAFIVIGLFIGLSWRPIWDDFHQRFPTVALSGLPGWPHNPPKRPAPILQSRVGKILFSCASPPGDKKAFEEWKKAFKNAAQIYGAATGLSISLSDIPKGVKIDMAPKTPEMQARMYELTKATIQAQRMSDQNVLVVYSLEMPGLFGRLLAILPLDVNAEQTKEIVTMIEQLFGMADKCQII